MDFSEMHVFQYCQTSSNGAISNSQWSSALTSSNLAFSKAILAMRSFLRELSEAPHGDQYISFSSYDLSDLPSVNFCRLLETLLEDSLILCFSLFP
eukprot:g73651.t1